MGRASVRMVQRTNAEKSKLGLWVGNGRGDTGVTWEEFQEVFMQG